MCPHLPDPNGRTTAGSSVSTTTEVGWGAAAFGAEGNVIITADGSAAGAFTLTFGPKLPSTITLNSTVNNNRTMRTCEL